MNKKILISIFSIVVFSLFLVSSINGIAYYKTYSKNTNTVSIYRYNTKILDFQLLKNSNECLADECNSLIKIKSYENLTLPNKKSNTFNFMFSKEGIKDFNFERRTEEKYFTQKPIYSWKNFNKTIPNIINYIDISNIFNPDIERCLYGNSQNTYKYNVTSNFNLNLSSGIICFNSYKIINNNPLKIKFSYKDFVVSDYNLIENIKYKFNPYNYYDAQQLVENKEYFIKITGKKSGNMGENIDWIPTIFGLKLKEFAWWNSSWQNSRSLKFNKVPIYGNSTLSFSWNESFCGNALCNDLVILSDESGINQSLNWVNLTNWSIDNNNTVYFRFNRSGNITSSDINNSYWVFYNNTNPVNPLNNGSEVFLFYDDFLGTSLSGSWYKNGGDATHPLIADGLMKYTDFNNLDNNPKITSLDSWGVNYSIISRIKNEIDSSMFIGFHNNRTSYQLNTGDGASFMLFGCSTNNQTRSLTINNDILSSDLTLGNWGANVFYNYKIIRNGSTNVLYYRDNNLLKTELTNLPDTNSFVSYSVHGCNDAINQYYYVDYVTVQKFNLNEPFLISFGNEEYAVINPVLTFDNPINGSVVSNNFNIDGSVIDSDSSGFTSVITLYYLNGSSVLTINNSNNTNLTQFTFNSSIVNNNDYFIKWNIISGNNGFDSKIHYIKIFNGISSNLEIPNIQTDFNFDGLNIIVLYILIITGLVAFILGIAYNSWIKTLFLSIIILLICVVILNNQFYTILQNSQTFFTEEKCLLALTSNYCTTIRTNSTTALTYTRALVNIPNNLIYIYLFMSVLLISKVILIYKESMDKKDN